jgi:TolA-binding protein
MLNKPKKKNCQIFSIILGYVMRMLFKFLYLFLLWPIWAFPGEILIKESSSISEIILKVPPQYIENYNYNGDTALIKFNKRFNINLKEYNKKVVKEITKNNDTLIIKANPWAKLFVAKEKDQIRIVIANTPQKSINVNVNTAGAIPVEDQSYKNEESEKALLEIKRKYNEKAYDEVIKLADKLIERNPLDKYGEEALYYQGLAYLGLGSESDKALFSAASIFDEFTKKFTKSRFLPEVMLKSAQTKEKLGFKNEAIYVYQEMLKTVKDEKYLIIAYTKIGQLFNELGQPDRALKYFTDYIQKSKPENSPVYGYVGAIYAQKNDFNKALEYFSKYKPRKLDEVPPDTLYWMAVTYENKGDADTALKLYTAFYNRYPDQKNADMAMYKSGDILLKKGKKDLAMDIFKDTKNKFSQQKGGILAAVDIAEMTLGTKDPEYWSVFLKDAMNNNIDISAAMKATKLYIYSLTDSKRYAEAVVQIDGFVRKFPDTKEAKELLGQKEEIYFNFIKDSFAKKDFDKANLYADKLMAEFPASQHIKEILAIKEDIDFFKVKSLYDNKKYAETVKQVEKYLLNNKNVVYQQRWYQLWEDALYAYVNSLTADPTKFGLNARQFISLFPNSKYVPELKNQMSANIQKEFDNIIKSNDFYNIVLFYQKNRRELDATDKKDFYIAKVAVALYMIGDRENASKLIKTTKFSNSETEMIKFILGITPNKFDINNYTEGQFEKIIVEIAQKDPVKAYNLAVSFKNKTVGIKKAIELIDTMSEPDKSKYSSNILKLLASQSDSIRRAAYKLYYSSAENAFIGKRYKEAIANYQNYLKYAPKNDPNIPDAIYFVGKSYAALGDGDLSIKYLTDVTKRFPNSQYATLAKSEIEDIKWKKLKR